MFSGFWGWMLLRAQAWDRTGNPSFRSRLLHQRLPVFLSFAVRVFARVRACACATNEERKKPMKPQRNKLNTSQAQMRILFCLSVALMLVNQFQFAKAVLSGAYARDHVTRLAQHLLCSWYSTSFFSFSLSPPLQQWKQQQHLRCSRWTLEPPLTTLTTPARYSSFARTHSVALYSHVQWTPPSCLVARKLTEPRQFSFGTIHLL